MNKRQFIVSALALASASVALNAQAQGQTIKIASLQELSGTGATVGNNFKNGMDLAIKEINAAGGILGKKIEVTHSDTQSNPGVAKGLAQKAVDDNVFAVFGPGFSGSILVSMS
jgi:branched-chain amino acid transport system substrate-binding protein